MSWTTPSAAGNDGPGAVQHVSSVMEECWTEDHEEGLIDMLGIGSDAFAGPIEDTSNGVEWSNAPPAPELKTTSSTAATQQTTWPATESYMGPAHYLAAAQDPCALLDIIDNDTCDDTGSADTGDAPEARPGPARLRRRTRMNGNTPSTRLAAACRCPIGAWVRAGLPTTATAAGVKVDEEYVDLAAGIAAAAAWEQAQKLRDVLTARTVAILSDVPADVCAILEQAEVECLRFFALPDAVKRQCTAPGIAAAAATAGAGVDTTGGGSCHGGVVSASHAEALVGGGYREHGPKWREQYHVVVGGWDKCFVPALASAPSTVDDTAQAQAPASPSTATSAAITASAQLAAALRRAQRWYEALCLAVSDLMCPGLADRLRLEVRSRRGDDPSVLDGFYYPNRARGTAEPNMSAHYDPGYVTVTAVSTTPGLDVLVRGDGADTHDGGWLDVEAHADAGTEIVLFLSESMRRAVATAADAWREAHERESGVGGGVKPPTVLECTAANHRVHRDTSEGAIPRSSLVYELRSHYVGV